MNSKNGIKHSDHKPPIGTMLHQFKHAMWLLAKRSKHGHDRYELGGDWDNFKRVPDPNFNYSNAQIRHFLGFGPDSDLEHLVANAWNALALLETHILDNYEEHKKEFEQ